MTTNREEMNELEELEMLEENTTVEDDTKETSTISNIFHSWYFLAFAIFMFAPLGVIWMWIDKKFKYKPQTKLIITIVVIALLGITFVVRLNSGQNMVTGK